MFKITFDKKSVFFSLLFNLYKFNKNLSFSCNKDYIEINGLDTNHVIFYNARINKNAFDSYLCEEEQYFKIDVKILNCLNHLVKNNNKITFSKNKNEDYYNLNMLDEKMKIEIKDKIKYDIDVYSFSVPDDSNFSSSFIMKPRLFKKICKFFKEIDEFIVIDILENNVSIKSEFSDNSVNLTNSENLIISYKENIIQKYDLDYICKCILSDFNFVSILMEKEMPIKFIYKLDNNMGNIKIFLAPIASNDEEKDEYQKNL